MVQLNQNFINSIAKDLPEHLKLEDFIHFCSLPLRAALRVNTLKISVDEFLSRMQAKGWQFETIPWCPEGFWYQAGDSQPGNCIEHQQGLFYIQEASSMLPPAALLEPGMERVLDMASAPGSKTTQMAAMMANGGVLIANEYSSSRVKVLHANLQRMGVSNTALTHFDARVFGQYQYESMDAVLLDAPCSGEGTVRKDPDALKHWDPQEIADIAATQRDLIDSAFLALKPGGVMVYSTCTLNSQENQAVLQHLKQKYGAAVVFESLDSLFTGAEKACTAEGFLHIWPQIYDSEGFFVAKVRKLSSVARESDEPKQQKQFPFTPASTKQQQAIAAELQRLLGKTLPEGSLWIRDQEYWLFPSDFEPFIGKMRYQRIGLKLADDSKHGLKLRHEALMALGVTADKGYEVTEPEAQAYLMGRDIALDGSEKARGELVLTWGGQVLGLGKHLGNRLKNNLPRELVKDKICLS
ncbi:MULTISPECIES: 16S rRNA (cytosine(1407)-C(5))-methyltransferase RsmF [Shewanella]|uniref:16S rRNA (cytosine(1407)-C(5))-methyltransferase RsmF n=1 Tax=Shewanella TaxID=22 RepID=UPI003004560C